MTAGSHKKTCVFGAITLDGRQLFRQYDTFDQYSFISYLRELKAKFHKLILFLDKHHSTIVPRESKHIWKKIVTS